MIKMMMNTMKIITMPAKAPLRVIRKLHFPVLFQRNCKIEFNMSQDQPKYSVNTKKRTLVKKRTDMPPVEAPRMVLTMANATTPPSPGFEIVVWEPPLNARKPKMRMKPPRPARGTEWPGMSMGSPFLLNLPLLAPMK